MDLSSSEGSLDAHESQCHAHGFDENSLNDFRRHSCLSRTLVIHTKLFDLKYLNLAFPPYLYMSYKLDTEAKKQSL